MASDAPAVSGARPQWRTFFTEFVKAPRKVASPLASSRLMVEQLLAPVDWSSIRTVVEYGPGTGSFTQVILDRLGSATRLIAVESETGLARHLSASIADPRLIVVNRCALDIGTIVQDLKTDRPDLIVSGLPFSSLPDTDRARLIAQSAALLAQEGHFLAYQVRRAIEPHLAANFRSVVQRYEWRNLPPCHLYWCANQP
ncbi:MAG: methyltransferase [Sphingomonadales bacterium]|nr:methyltransferase [Sphingomonadales bacterium]